MLWFSALVFALGVILNLNAEAPPQPQVLAEHVVKFPEPPPCVSPNDLDVLVDKFNALPASYVPQDLTDIEKFLLREEAATQLETIFNEMRILGFKPSINSAYRSYDDQDYINVGDNMKSAQPGHSEHQLGTAVDLHLTNAAWNWLDQNAHRYGFVMSYRANQVILTGYKYEPWHWRYVGVDLASQISNSPNTPQSFYKVITCKDV